MFYYFITETINYLTMAARINGKMEALFQAAEIIRKTTEVIF